MLMLNVNESVATRHDIELVDDSMFVGSDEIPGGTSYIIMNKTSSSSASDNLPPMLIVLLVILCECFLLIDIVYIFLFKKHRQSATYHILTHYMIFKLMFCFAEFFNILSSVALEETDFHLKPTDAICFMGRYFTFVAESAMNFHIVLIWVVLLSERRIIGFRSLLSDFELRNACAITPMSTSPQPPLVTPTQPSTAIMTPSPSLADNLVTANGNNTNTQEQQGKSKRDPYLKNTNIENVTLFWSFDCYRLRAAATAAVDSNHATSARRVAIQRRLVFGQVARARLAPG